MNSWLFLYDASELEELHRFWHLPPQGNYMDCPVGKGFLLERLKPPRKPQTPPPDPALENFEASLFSSKESEEKSQ